MNNISLLSRIGNYVANNMAQNIYTLSQLSQNITASNYIESHESASGTERGIVCGVSVCGSEEKKNKEHCL